MCYVTSFSHYGLQGTKCHHEMSTYPCSRLGRHRGCTSRGLPFDPWNMNERTVWFIYYCISHFFSTERMYDFCVDRYVCSSHMESEDYCWKGNGLYFPWIYFTRFTITKYRFVQFLNAIDPYVIYILLNIIQWNSRWSKGLLKICNVFIFITTKIMNTDGHNNNFLSQFSD